MKKLQFIILMALLFIQAGCSLFSETTRHNSTREVASEIISLRELMTIESSSALYPDVNYTLSLKNSINQPRGVTYEFVTDELMSSDTAFRIVPEIKDRTFKIKIFQSANAQGDRIAVAQLDRFLNLLFRTSLHSQFSFYELYFNAHAKDLNSLHILTKLRQKAIFEAPASSMSGPEVKEFASENAQKYAPTLEAFEKAQRAQNKIIKTQTDARKLVMNALDSANEDQQFRTLVAKNDRKGATALLRKYLPWELMPPIEKEFWETQLTVIANPLPIEQRVLLYRGISDDLVQTGYKNGKKLVLEEALTEQNIFLMSTMMTKNQGTWNRRLRSLTAMYEKFIATDDKTSSEFTKASRLTVMFKNHSDDPKGSPFLSFTPKFEVSENFGVKRNTIYFVDPRLVYFNFTSKFQNEVEYLMPLITFPDDLAALYDKNVPHLNGIAKGVKTDDYLRKTALEKLRSTYGKEKGDVIWKQINQNSTELFEETMQGYGKNFLIDPGFLKIYRKVSGIPLEAIPVSELPHTNLKCVDLLKEFWK